ncbi:MAG: site-specific DNA-methyltransferase [Sphaerochaetaceae bacterium]|nr:site-specific DNA-methyltransferase [Sphaerochaetaceae bacterium]
MTKAIKLDKLELTTKDLHEENIAKLSELFPQLLTEMEVEETDSEGNTVKKLVKTIDSEKLKELVGDYAKKDSEIYELTWAGKQDSKRKIAEPITKTLRPVKNDSVDFENTSNLYIEGDNFEVLKLLQNSYLGKIKMIYIDPPYNTGKDFVYKDNFRTSKAEHDEESGVVDEEGNKLVKNVFTNGRFHSDWLSMMYERLVLARDVLKDDGVVFISIDDNEVDNLKKVCNEIFGEANFITQFVWQKKTQPSFLSKEIANVTEYILTYKKNENQRPLKGGKTDTNRTSEMINIGNPVGERVLSKNSVIFENGNFSGTLKIGSYGKGVLAVELLNQINILNGKSDKDIKIRAKIVQSQETIEQGIRNGWEIHIKSTKSFRPTINKNLTEASIKPPISLLSKKLNMEIPTNTDASNEIKELFGGVNIMDYPKPVNLIKYLADAITFDDKSASILDFFSGSATTAHAIMQLNSEDQGNRKFIMVQLPEETDKDSEAFKAGYKNICEIGKERIRRATKKIKDELKEKNKQQKLGGEKIDIDSLDFGFKVFRIDESNMKDVYYHPSQVTQAKLDGLADNIKEDRSPEDLLYQVLLDLAIPISAKVTEEKIDNKKVFRVEHNFLIACFDSDVSLDLVKKIAEAKPERLVFRDSSFKDDKEKVNCEEFLKHSLPNTIIKVI